MPETTNEETAMSRPRIFLTRMAIFLAAVLVVAAVLSVLL